MMMLKSPLILIFLCCLSVHNVKSKESSKASKGNGTVSCGLTNATSTRNASKVRIIHAQEAEKGAWPWMAEIFTTKRSEKSPVCGGALLNRFYVVTAAHCMIKKGREVWDPKDVTVRLGDHNLKSDKDGMNPINSNVTSINVPDDFDPRTHANDIALLRLEHPVAFNRHVQPVCLPENENLLTDEDRGQLSGYVTGWGATTLGGSTSDVLMEMSALITPDEVCREAYKGIIAVTEGNICSVGVNSSNPCQGFGGAPVVLPGKDNRYHIVGIVSFGYGCGVPEFPDVHTRVSKFLDWIGEFVI